MNAGPARFARFSIRWRIGATLVALFWANSPWAAHYFAVRESPLTLELFGWVRTGTFESWVADALLPLFFFVAGLEIKRELVRGSLARSSTASRFNGGRSCSGQARYSWSSA